MEAHSVSRARVLGLVVAIVSLAGCDSFCDERPRFPVGPSTTNTARAEITPAQERANVGDSVKFTGRIVGTVPSGSTVQATWTIGKKEVASITATDTVNQTITVKCDAADSTSITLSAVGGVDSATATLTCVATATTTTSVPPSNGPSVESVIGTYVKHGKRLSGNCVPPLFNAEWDAELDIFASTEGNLGIKMVESHALPDSTAPWLMLPYSQFTADSGPNRELNLTSGTPSRTIGGRDFVTQLKLTFKADGSFSGTETFAGPGPCSETYELSGRRK